MNLINIQNTNVSVQVRYINPIERHPFCPGNVLAWVAQTFVVWVKCLMFNVQCSMFNVQCSMFKCNV